MTSMRPVIKFLDRLFARKFLLPALLLIFLIFGCIASLQPGLTVDDPTEQKTFRIITNAAKSLLLGHWDEYDRVKLYHDRYYGIGLDVLGYPCQLLLRSYLASRLQVDIETASLLARHSAVFLLFGISVVVFYRYARLFIRNRCVAAIITAAYAACPYLFGHSMINLRDSPFMSLYLACTYLSIRLVRRHTFGRAQSFRTDILGLALATATLVSVRIPGLMILAQYGFTFLLADRCRLDSTRPKVLRWQNITWFSLILVGAVIVAFPAVWLNPFGEIFAGMNYVGWYYQPGCTLTWGQCMPPYASVSYIFGWLVVKLPIIIFIGLAVIPFVLRKICRDPLQRTAYLTLLFGTVYVLIVIIPLRARLYDETRQLLFIYPLLFLLAFVGLYFASKRLALVLALLAFAIFSWDQARLHPYQYVYFNEFGRFLNIDKLFETDYWGTSAREHARSLSESLRADECLYADPFFLYQPFLRSQACVEPLENITGIPDEGVTVAITCSPNRIRVPASCQPLSAVTRTLPLSNRTMNLSVAYRCSR